MIKVFIVDDHGLVRAGIKRLLADAEGIKVVGEAASGEEALSLIPQKQPDVVLMDIDMPRGMGGLEAMRRLLQHNSNAKILIITVFSNEPFPRNLLNAGAAGFLSKGISVQEMLQAIRTVYAGQRYIPNEIAKQLAFSQLSDNEGSPFNLLTEREMQITYMVLKGQRVQEIADNLCLSPKTIHSYRQRVFNKLNVRSDLELMRLAIRYEFLNPRDCI